METATLWSQFKGVTDTASAVRVSHAIFQAVADDRHFRGEPLATVPRPLHPNQTEESVSAWRLAVMAWARHLTDALKNHFKNIHTLNQTRPHHVS
jgi:hypothetical protein